MMDTANSAKASGGGNDLPGPVAVRLEVNDDGAQFSVDRRLGISYAQQQYKGIPWEVSEMSKVTAKYQDCLT